MSNQRTVFMEALRKLEPVIRRAFEAAIARASAAVNIDQLAELISTGQIEDAARLLRVDQSLLWPLHEAVRDAYIGGGQMASGQMLGLTGLFQFDGRHTRAEAWVREHAGSLIEGIQSESLDTTRRVIGQGIAEGRSSRAVALEITGRRVGKKRVGGYLGLNSVQADSIIRGRGLLLSGDPDQMRQYLGLKLRDRRYDRTIRKAMREGRAIKGQMLDKIMEAHRSKALGYRGRVIAKHEARQALSAGREEAFQQALEREDVEGVSVRWQHNLSADPRHQHVAMNGAKIELGGQFEFPDGVTMKHPHDEDAPASHTIGCNCVAMYRLKMRRG